MGDAGGVDFWSAKGGVELASGGCEVIAADWAGWFEDDIGASGATPEADGIGAGVTAA